MRRLNRNVILMIAMAAMCFNHLAQMFLSEGKFINSAWKNIVASFTASVISYFLVEGYLTARSKRKYGLRLLLSALLSQIPFWLTFGENSGNSFLFDVSFGKYGLNVFFTLLCCFLILLVMENLSSPLLQVGMCFALTVVTILGEWGVVAPIFTILFCRAWENRKKMIRGFWTVYLIVPLINLWFLFEKRESWAVYALFHGSYDFLAILGATALSEGLLSGLGILAAGAVLLFLDNGEQTERGQAFFEWGFYLFYPLHLFLLYAIEKFT